MNTVESVITQTKGIRQKTSDYLRSVEDRAYGRLQESFQWQERELSKLDESPTLNPSLASYYQSQIGILRWMVEIGRIDIMTEGINASIAPGYAERRSLGCSFACICLPEEEVQLEVGARPYLPNDRHGRIQGA